MIPVQISRQPQYHNPTVLPFVGPTLGRTSNISIALVWLIFQFFELKLLCVIVVVFIIVRYVISRLLSALTAIAATFTVQMAVQNTPAPKSKKLHQNVINPVAAAGNVMQGGNANIASVKKKK